MNKLIVLLVALSGCAGAVVPPDPACELPAALEACKDAGGLTRCIQADGSIWDLHGDGTATHYTSIDYDADGRIDQRVLCETR